MRNKDEVFYRSLASSGATAIALIGVVHEVAGHLIFPWAPAALGGPIGWHGLGFLAIMTGLALLAGTLRLVRLPVVTLSVVVAAIALVIAVLTAVLYEDFHLFALLGCATAGLTAYCHRRAENGIG